MPKPLINVFARPQLLSSDTKRWIFFPVIVIAGLQVTGQTLSEPEFLPVDEAYPTQASLTEDGRVKASWLMPDGYYLYKHSLKIEGIEGTRVGELIVPEGIEKFDEFFGDTEVFYSFLEISAPIESQAGDVAVDIHYQGCADAGLCYPPEVKTFRFDVLDASLVSSEIGQESLVSSAAVSGANIFVILGSAFIAGMILNLMPCVFPVLSLKAVGAIEGSHRRSQLIHALGYTGGIVGTLLLVALLLVVLRSAGESVGWGFQLQSPAFVVCMALLFFVLGLNMLGVIEIPGFSTSMGSTNAISTGFLAVVVATPCTVPFMAPAIGYGLMEGSWGLVAIMVMLGLGLALPYVLITTVPSLAKRLPKSGPWLGTFKTVMAFPLLLSAVWLLWVLTRQEGAMAMAWALVGAVSLGAVMIVARTSVRLLKPAWVTMCVVVGVVAWGVLSDDEQRVQRLAGQFDLAALDNTVDTRKPVFVNVTADWCLTCLVNERSTLSRSVVQEYFDEQAIEYVEVDWTNRDSQVTQYLERFGRVGVPLYVFYPNLGEPKLLPQILTPDLLMSELSSNSANQVVFTP